MKTVRKITRQDPAIRPRKRVAAYARVSMETERLQHSLSAQISRYNDMIQKNPDWIFAGVYADNASLIIDWSCSSIFYCLFHIVDINQQRPVICLSIVERITFIILSFRPEK